MDLALREVVTHLRGLSHDELLNLDPEELTRVSAFLSDAVNDKNDKKCSEAALYWAQNFTMTENPHWEQQGLLFIAHFPVKSYFVPLFDAFKNHSLLFVPKSREMLTSWCVMAYAAHAAQWAKAEVIVQTAKEDKARRLVEYAAILYRNQAEWLKRRHPLKRDATALSIEWADGGKLYGIPGGEDQIRMYHPSIYIMDESAFMPHAEACYNAVLPVAQQIIAISSAGPGWFGDQCSR